MRNIWMAVGLASALALAGCGSSSSTAENANREATASTNPSGAAATPDMENGATVMGKVAFTGTAPVMKTLDMSANPPCMRAHANSPAKSEEVVVNGNGTLKNVFVWVKSGLPEKNWAVPTTPVELDQQGCMYAPHVFGVMAGQGIEIKNSDPTNHNIHPMPQGNQEWNESQPPGSDAKVKSFARQEVMIPVKCNVHNWMRAYIGVVAHPFYAVTGADGNFVIKGLPPGTYTIETWQEKYGVQDQQVTVGPKDSKTLDFVYKG